LQLCSTPAQGHRDGSNPDGAKDKARIKTLQSGGATALSVAEQCS
jgi:hypothetical protein